MSDLDILLILAVAVPLILFLRLLIPLLWSLFGRLRLHGPAPITTPNSGGRWVGWVVGMIWSLFEQKREERFEYGEMTRAVRWDEDSRPAPVMGLPLPAQPALALMDAPGDILMSRDHQQLSPDGRHWWSGREWVSTDRFVPPSAPRSVDGSHWWDGSEWRWMPGEWPDLEKFLPQPASSQAGVAPVAESWMERRRLTLSDRWYDKMHPVATDPAKGLPKGFPAVPGRADVNAPRRRRWRRQG